MDTRIFAKLGKSNSFNIKDWRCRFLTSFLQKWPGGGHENQNGVCVFVHKVSISLLTFGWEKKQAWFDGVLFWKIAVAFMNLIDKKGPCGLLNYYKYYEEFGKRLHFKKVSTF